MSASSAGDARSPGGSKPALQLSVVVPTHGRPAEITRLCRQLADQTLAPSAYEVVIVDDGSPRDVAKLLAGEAHDFDLTIERQERGGSAAARQRGAERARGQVLVFLDDDMSIGPGFLESHLDAHGGGDERLVVLGRRRAGREAGALPVLERYRVAVGERLADEVAAGRLALTGEYLYTGNLSIPRALFEEVGGFDPELFQICDAELGIRLQKAGARFVLSDAAFNVHERDPMTDAEWLARAMRDGVYWSRVASKHPETPVASPWHWLELVSPASRPLLTLSAMVPGPAALLARAALASTEAVGSLRLDRVAMAGATFTYGVQMFRGVGDEAGSMRSAMRAYREFRRAHRDLSAPSRSAAARELVQSIREDHRLLVETNARYDPRQREIPSPAAAFVVNIGFQIVVGYRLMRFLHARGLSLAARIVARAIRHAYGADIHWDAELAPGLVVVHGFGLAISHGARTGPGCILSQNVTLGMGRDPGTGATGAPELGEGVVVGPGAALIGPIVVGDRSKIMAGCTVSESVPAHSIVEAPAVSIRPR